MTTVPDVPVAQPSITPLPRWVAGVGWGCVAGCAVFVTAVACEILELPDWEVVGGFTDYFLPGPRALGMLLWELRFLWVFVVSVQLIRLKRRGQRLRPRDVVLGASLLVGAVAGRLLVAELASRGVRIGIPGVDH